LIRRIAAVSLFTCVFGSAGTASADSLLASIAIEAGPLPNSLQSLERQTGIELLFDSSVVRGLQSPAVVGSLKTEDALKELLAGTTLSVRQSNSGAWIVERPSAAPLERPDAAVPEILVVGQNTQNADIRRFENDIQPYVVVTKDKIVQAHRDDLEQYFRSRVTADTQIRPAQDVIVGGKSSKINLRGLGQNSTLVLIDGRRMPSLPASGDGFGQADLNSIPLHAIDRVEVLTGAAGGIYGYGALGGVVNVVLDRSSRGLDLHYTGGVTSRGNGGRQSIEASFGQTFNEGSTDVVVFAGYSKSDPLLYGDRPFAARDRRLTMQNLEPPHLMGDQAYGNSITVTTFAPNLTFKPEYGGTTLPTTFTYLPAGFSGDTAALVASFTEHAGQADSSVPASIARSDLTLNPESKSLFANIRHRFGNGLEAYADVVRLHSSGHSNDPTNSVGGSLSPDSPANPFTDFVFIEFPVTQLGDGPSFGTLWTQQIDSARYTGGLQTELPFDWRGTVEVGRSTSRFWGTMGGYYTLNRLNLFGDPSDPAIDPFGDWTTLQRAVAQDPYHWQLGKSYRNRSRDDSLRLAGPLFDTAAGPTTLTLLAERRAEKFLPAADSTLDNLTGEDAATLLPVAGYSIGTDSISSELRASLFDVELQLAARRDEQTSSFARNVYGDEGARLHAEFAGTTYTVGAKYSPWNWLMIRSSYATGDQPPEFDALRVNDPQTAYFTGFEDPKRANRDVAEDGPVVFESGGNTALEPVHVSTLFYGAVLTPFGPDAARFSLDYSLIRKSRDVVYVVADIIMEHEDDFPQRVTRAPLTDEDRALGYTAGRVLVLDARYLNGARAEVKTLDARAEWPMALFGGRLRLYADATYHMSNQTQNLYEPAIQNSNYLDGPLKWRANGGIEWSTELLTIGANVQYFGHYLVARQNGNSTDEYNLMVQGSDHIPSQTYVDLQASWRVPAPWFGSSNDLTMDFGIVNVLDQAPPRQSRLIDFGPGYSRYGDPRMRRFELGLNAHF
jgi:iron complex outermembrane recepter protein